MLWSAICVHKGFIIKGFQRFIRLYISNININIDININTYIYIYIYIYICAPQWCLGQFRDKV